MSDNERLKHYLEQSARSLIACQKLEFEILKVVDVCVEAISSNCKILWCGNGGSASDSLHLSTELVGRFKKNRKPISSMSLSTNVALITALANDYGYESVFERQVEAFGRKGDVCIGISTSGESRSVINALAAAQDLGVTAIAFTGEKECSLWSNADVVLAAPTSETSHIQECHITLGQFICGEIERYFFGD